MEEGAAAVIMNKSLAEIRVEFPQGFYYTEKQSILKTGEYQKTDMR